MAFHKTGKGPQGLDDGLPKTSKKRKRGQDDPTNNKTAPTPAKSEASYEIPKIMPGERLADFSARVNQAIPIAGLAKKAKNMEGVKERTTKHAKRLQKMQAAWREEEVRRKEKDEEKRELAEEEEEEQRAEYGDAVVPDFTSGGKKGKKGKQRGRQIGEISDDEEDPWKVVEARREKPKGIFDVVQAPPTFAKKPKEVFKVKGGAKVQVSDVPNAAGSLRKREELGQARKDIIEQYRQIMDKRRGVAT